MSNGITNAFVGRRVLLETLQHFNVGSGDNTFYVCVVILRTQKNLVSAVVELSHGGVK